VKPYTCWEQREVARTLVDDANRDAPAVFSAVHRPARVLRQDIRRRAGDPGEPVGERDVLEALLGGDPDADRIVPIVGQSGTGKSHLIRWLHAHIDERPDRHVVYIEKRGTSLRQVIHKILAGLDGPEIRHRERFIELREEVDKAAEGLDPELARFHLLTHLSLALREHAVDNAQDQDDQLDREELADGLADLILDPVFRPSLLRDDGVIARTVERALGRGDADGEAPAFQRLELDVRDITRAGATAQDVRANIYGEDGTHDLAVRMLNEQLNPALGALIGVDRTQVFDVMLQVREALLDEGKTLVLLVEDFALLRGVETQLLDAMIADAESQGERVLCPMRSALAVTSGYFEGKDTALTRIHSRGRYVYSLDAQLGEATGAVTAEELRAFVSTYLNAARMGRSSLEAQFERRDRSADDDRAWVPNACEECSFKPECHDGFGAADGYGLYPFNASALRRIAASQFELFDPRHLLKILDDTLTSQHDAILNADFPSPEWAAPYDRQQVPGRPPLPVLPAPVGVRYEQLDPANAERRKTLATFWGGVPSAPVNFHEAIHDAFAIPALPDLERVVTEGPKQTEQPEPTPQPSPEPTASSRTQPTARERENLALDAWGAGQGLDQALANRVRGELASAVRAAREWPAFGIDAKTLESVVANPAFSLGRGAKGEGSGAIQPLATLEPSNANAYLLQGVLEAGRQGDWSFDDGLDRFIRFTSLVDDWAEEALRRLRDKHSGSAIARLLLLGGAVLGLAGPGDEREALVASLFESPELPSGSDAWTQLQRRLVEGPSGAAARRELAEALRTSHALQRSLDRGDATIALDVAPIVAEIDAADADGWTVPPSDALQGAARDVRLYADALRRDLAAAVHERLADLAARRGQALTLLGSQRDATAVAAEVQEALQEAVWTGVSATVGGVDEHEVTARFRNADLRALDRLSALERHDELDWPGQLSLIVAAGREDLGAIDRYVAWADVALNSALQQTAARLAGEGEDDASVSAATARLVTTLRDLAGELEEARA
jgi:hypothetical protein